jgi:F0F1-type ATP synthase assembly protein I
MVSLTALWIPIVLSAVVVFIASSVIHMALKYHNSEYRQLPDEDAVLGSMRGGKIAPGFYSFPYAASMKEMGSPEMMKKYEQGPVGTANINPSGPPAMGKALGLWFVYTLVVGVFAGYLASRTLDAGAHYLQVFRIVGCSSFMAYSLAHLSDSIWKTKPWSMTLKHVFDGLVYALLTAGVFGWLWP